MGFLENQSLKTHNTFGLDSTARFFAAFPSEEALRQLLQQHTPPLFVLGGGSNILLTQDFPGTVLKNDIKGIVVVEDTATHQRIKVGGGEVWHDFVLWSIEQGLGGIENLSLIPGSVGAAPMQNIGAYGVEIESVFEKLEAIAIDTGQKRIFEKEECQFAYRHSIFKGVLKGHGKKMNEG